MRKLIISVVFALALLTTPLFGNDYYGQGHESFEVPQSIGVGIAANFGGCTGECADDIDPGAGIALNVSYRPSMSFGVYLEAMTNFFHPANEENMKAMYGDDVNLSSYQVNLGLNFFLFPTSRFQPLITAGVGHWQTAWQDEDGDTLTYVDENGDTQELKSDAQETIFVGLGGEYIINGNMTIPFKLQYSKVIYNNNDTSKDSLWNVVVGFNYYF